MVVLIFAYYLETGPKDASSLKKEQDITSVKMWGDDEEAVAAERPGVLHLVPVTVENGLVEGLSLDSGKAMHYHLSTEKGTSGMVQDDNSNANSQDWEEQE